MENPNVPPQPDRRSFLTKFLAIVFGGIGALFAPAAGLFVLFDPLRRKSAAAEPVRVATLSAVPENGTPVKVSVLKTHVDVWNRTPNVPVGAVYLQRVGPGQVRAFNAKCPHAGCFVNFKSAEGHYHCPCHNSSFSLDGSILSENSPSPRTLDELQAEVRDNEVWVTFQNFRTGIKEREPV